ncbi:DUF2182 domain-containing protein [Pseudoalteromonas luteoviolacea]|uniref:DUF2182 domain-containing protein n=1 Tax=Pseudoalteromonas luteoviolacea TaxID=43657 RepID=UPI001F3B9BF1|nr:DUF2182 domain-containing protein [Pseudoalteromonas luteoviolacea]MCF6441401.1 DUF2182 domain-containing protein [Pseudoalteromonas luteoviolacea]
MATLIFKKVSAFRVAHPHWFVLCLAALIWMYYLSTLLGTSTSHHHHHAHHDMHAQAGFASMTWQWMLMVFAMMLPMTSGTIRSLVNSVPIYRQQLSLALFIIGYASVWLVFGVVLLLATHMLQTTSWTAELNVLPIAALGYFAAGMLSDAAFRMRLLNACGSIWSPRLRGFKADLDVLTIGLKEGIKCVKTCAHVMIAMHIAGHGIVQMGILTAALFYEATLYRNKKHVLRNTCYVLAAYQLIVFYLPHFGH